METLEIRNRALEEYREKLTWSDLKALVNELKKKLKADDIQSVKEEVLTINKVFKNKYDALLDKKKEVFLSEGGNEIDFHYKLPIKSDFDNLYANYKDRVKKYHQKLKETYSKNYKKKLEVIEGIKQLVGTEESMGTTFKKFKELQDQWKSVGLVSRDKYENLWRTYRHHVEIFYDFLHLNSDLRDKDFQHNLEKKKKIIELARGLTNEKDAVVAFRELQKLHMIWKEDTGPVSKDHREAVWEEFSALSKEINDRHKKLLKGMHLLYEENIQKCEDIIQEVDNISANPPSSHKQWEKVLKQLDEYHESFKSIGPLPVGKARKIWDKFKVAKKKVYSLKNDYHKSQRVFQRENLDRKKSLLKRVEAIKDSEEWEKTTEEIKAIQKEWKTIGHAPRKDSDKIWEAFKTACNHYFERLHSKSDRERLEIYRQTLENKKTILKELQEYKSADEKDAILPYLKSVLMKWIVEGASHNKSEDIQTEFEKAVTIYLESAKMTTEEADTINYSMKVAIWTNANKKSEIKREKTILSRQLKDLDFQTGRLEGNMMLFKPSKGSDTLVSFKKNLEESKLKIEVLKDKIKLLSRAIRALEKQFK
ncbi:chromosome segregation protein [Elysia marginata]|uniref:Chromosome segregation protein n=1 Tax=Elysia marginata TaxID=1093978 RepID=A0AAV4JA86_9GAST|nr:chromosome segregation protein [Elysia marginata]